MRTITLLSLAALGSGLAAQSNAVAGLDGRLTVINNLTNYGRRGPAYPNGEAGMAMLNTMCNPGSVNIPWFAAMQPNHPKFGFIIARVAGDKIEQINEWSFCKHAFTSTNFSGACGTCTTPGGSQMGLNCSDTYGAGNNASRFWLGPPEEIDPWLGTWDPVGSYFDIGDPAQAGYPAPADGVRSLSQSIFDNVDNRVTVDEIDFVTPGASYYYGLQLIHEGEPVANRGDNLAHRGFTPNWSGSSWSYSNTAEGQQYGTVLERWTGADIDVGQNGNDDGRFYVAVKTTPLGAGNYHYEYAVHNVDNSRAGGSFRVPVEPGTTVSNYTFGDIDTNAANDWTGTRVGNEIIFTAPLGNPLEWNTIYNFGFDVDFPPGSAVCQIDAARVGAGALWVDVPTKVPAGSTYATITSIGDGCGGSPGCAEAIYEYPNFDLANSSFTFDYAAGDYTLVAGAGSWITPTGAQGFGDDTVQNYNIPFSLPFPGGSTSTLRVCSNGWVTTGAYNGGANYVPVVGTFLGNEMWCALWRDLNPGAGGDVYVDSNSSRAVVSWVGVPNYSNAGSNTLQIQFWNNGDVHVIYQNITVSGSYLVGYSLANASDPGSVDLSASLNASLGVCGTPIPPIPDVALTASARPVLGTTISLDTTNFPAGSWFGLSILSLTEVNPGLDLTFLGMPGCTLYASLDVIDQFPVVGSSGSRTFALPNDPNLSGIVLMNQSATLSPGVNAFGFATSNGLRLLTGTL